MKRVLLTGASGFIGYHLVRKLSRKNCEIRVLVRQNSATDFLRPFNVRFYRGDLANRESLDAALDGCDTVFHLAGRVRAKDWTEFFETNAQGTTNLARAASQQNVPPTFIYVSSLAVMGPSRKNAPKRENDIPAPITDYGRSKLEGEKSLSDFADVMPCSIVRPGIVYGEADRMNLELFKTVKKMGVCPIPGWQDRIYSWIHADDLAELMISVARTGERLPANGDSPSSQGIYFAADGDGIELSRFGYEIGRALGRKKTIALRCPPVAVFAVSTFYETLKRTTGKDQPYDWSKAKESMYHWRCSSEKAISQLDFRPLASFPERVAQTTDWYRKEGWI